MSNATVPAGGQLPVRNPRTGEADYSISPPSAEELRGMTAKLRWAQGAWHEAGVEHRVAVLKQWSARLLAQPGPLLDALSVDTGRYLLAQKEVRALGGIVAGFSAIGLQVLAEAPERASVTPGIGIRSQLVPNPLVGVISPWNFPFLLSVLDSVAALVAGCAVIVKPSEVTPRFVAPVRESLAEFPELSSVFAWVTGDGRTGAELIGEVDAVCFTGSVATGRKVAESCARHFIPAFLELGGKDPAIVLGSADVGRAADIVLRASVQATGQACQSLERVYVDERIYPRFVAALVERARAVQLNYPDIHRGQIGPLIFARQAEIIADHLADARAKGAQVLCGGEIETHGGGLWIRPTVLTGVSHDMKVMREETFGPLMPVMSYRTVDEAVALANDSEYGLTAAVIGDEQEAIAVARRLEAGAVSINDGALTTEVFDAEKNAFRMSGLGASRMGPSGVLRFLRRKALLIQHGRAKDIGALEERLAGS
jgi:acyl-CoA reductase-like NAD-dependent aldehyde dehydrogenase